MNDYLFDQAVQRKFEEAERLAGLDPKTKVIFDKLYRLRREVAERERVPAYRVMPNHVLLDLAEKRPQTYPELVAVRGLGAARLKMCGDSILDKLQHCAGPEAVASAH